MAYRRFQGRLDKYVYDMAPYLEGTGDQNLLDPAGWHGPRWAQPQRRGIVLPGALVPVLRKTAPAGSCSAPRTIVRGTGRSPIPTREPSADSLETGRNRLTAAHYRAYDRRHETRRRIGTPGYLPSDRSRAPPPRGPGCRPFGSGAVAGQGRDALVLAPAADVERTYEIAELALELIRARRAIDHDASPLGCPLWRFRLDSVLRTTLSVAS